MGGLIIRLVVTAVALWAAQFVVNLFIPGGMVLTTALPGLLIVVLLFGIVNALVKPVVGLLSCPITILTLGLFTLVINALMLLLTSYFTSIVGDSEWLRFSGPGDGFVAAILAGLAISIVSTVMSQVVGDA
jgi:putative membrane protein